MGAERRRLGEMMGLRIRTDEMLEVLEVVQRKRWGTGREGTKSYVFNSPI